MNGATIYPAAGIIVMAIEAAKQLAHKDRQIVGFQLKEMKFSRALSIPAELDGTETRFTMRALKDGSGSEDPWSEYRLWAYDGGEWTICCHGYIQVEYENKMNEVDSGREFHERAHSCQAMIRKGSAACTQSMSTAQLYETFHAMGAGYGPAFQVLDEVSFNESGLTVAMVKLRQWNVKGQESDCQPHVIHPTALDGVFQMIVPGLSKGGRDNIPTMVPTFIDKLWVAGSTSEDERAPPMRACADSRFEGYRKAASSVVAVSSSNEGLHPRIIMEGLETTFVTSSQESDSDGVKKRHLCCNLDFKPDLDLITTAQAQEFCDASRPKTSSPAGFYKDLQVVIYSFIKDTLETLDKRNVTKLEPHHVKYVDWMRHQLDRCKNGKLAICHDDIAKLQTVPEFRESLIKRVERHSVEGAFFIEVGRKLPDILDGLVDPLELLFKGDLANEYYQAVHGAPQLFAPFATYLDTLAHKNPLMKILEIGAGTGGATLHTLNTLMRPGENELGFPRFSEYHFTDISPAFFERAQTKFKGNLDRITFSVLDIESDPVSQGFKEGEYDMIIAANVLHATRNISTTLKNTRKLLKPGCPLVLFEVTDPENIRAGFAFGLLQGWWVAQEENRQRGPCLSMEAWEQVLGDADFSGPCVIVPDCLEETYHEASIMIAKARKLSTSLSELPQAVIVINEESALQRDLACELQSRLFSPHHSRCEVTSLLKASQRADLDTVVCVVLLEIGQTFLNAMSDNDFAQVKAIITTSKSLLWATQERTASSRRPEFDMVTGFARALRSEYTQLRFATLALESSQCSTASSCSSAAQHIINVLKRTISSPLEQYESEYIERNGRMEIGRVIEADYLNHSILTKISPQQRGVREFASGPPLSLRVKTPGLLDSLEFIEDTDVLDDLRADEVEVEVMATGVNFRDCLIALGELNEKDIGTDCAGIVRRVGGGVSDLSVGDKVSVCAMGTYKSLVRCKASCVVKMLDQISFTEAASLPTVGITAYHALCNIARIGAGESVLIHSGAGGTGQLAIQIAKYLRARVYVTVSSLAKKQMLMDRYAISEECIFYSRDVSFAQGIQRLTRGHGVDVVLNSLSGAGLKASWECMAPFGRFVEIGKRDIHAHADLPMFQFAKNVSFSAVDLTDIIRERPGLLHELFRAVMALVSQGIITPAQPMHTFPASEITQAFRSLQGGHHTGKMVIEFGKDNLVPVSTLHFHPVN